MFLEGDIAIQRQRKKARSFLIVPGRMRRYVLGAEKIETLEEPKKYRVIEAGSTVRGG